MTRSLWLALFVLFLLLPMRAYAQTDDTWLVAIGNDDGDGDETSLLYAERDAREMADAFRVYGGVSGRSTTMLLGERADAVRRGLLEANTEIRSAAGEGRQTTLIVFYSGHADANALHLDRTHLGFDELRAIVASSPARVRILIVDSCRSGSVTRVKGVKPAQPFAIALDDQSSAQGTVIITSSAAGESSQESDALGGSFFSHHWINALRGAADRDGDFLVTLNEAYAYAYAQTLLSTGRTLALQHPTYAYDVKGRAPIVLARIKKPETHTGIVRLGETATYLIRPQSGGHVTAELTPEEKGAKVALPEGSYVIQQRFPDEYREYKIVLPRGRELDLTHEPYESARYDRLVRKGSGQRERAHGLLALASVHGELVDEGPAPSLILGYTVDFPWSTTGLRLRLGRSQLKYDDGVGEGHHDEIMGGFTFARVRDLSWASVGFGVLLEAGVHRQTRDAPREVTRNAWGASFGALASLERALWNGLALRLEAGPITALFHRADVKAGAIQGEKLESRLTYWLSGGMLWRL